VIDPPKAHVEKRIHFAVDHYREASNTVLHLAFDRILYNQVHEVIIRYTPVFFRRVFVQTLVEPFNPQD
jgi:hypothetical protein